MKKRITSILLALVLCLSLLPTSVLANEADVQWAGAMNYNDANNLVTATASVTAPENTELKWQYRLGTTPDAWTGAYYAGQTVIADGYLYATGDGKLHKINISTGTGEVINESAGSTASFYDYLCYADGKLLVATQTKISAYSLEGTPLGSVEGSFGFYHPVQYHGDYVFCNGNIFSLSNDGKTFTRVGNGTIGGDVFNWSSGAFVNNRFYVVAKTKIYAVDYTKNTVTDSFEFDASRTATNNTQGGVAYDSGTKRLYWGTYDYNTDIHSIALNDQGKFDTESYLHADAGQQTVCTPVVSGGRVYLAGQSGNISVLDAVELSLIYSAPTGATKIQSNPILSTAGDAVRVYVQGYDGNLYVMQDNNKSGAVTKLAERLNPSGVQFPNAYEQIAMDTRGNVYCYNESGFLFCYGPSACEVPQITEDLNTAEVKYGLNAAAAALTVSAEVSDGGELSYQWQSGTDGLTWANIAEATAASYTPQTETTANTYYRCVVTNTKETNHAVAYSSAAYIVTKVLGTDTGLSVFTSTGSNIATGDPVEIQPTDNHYDVLNIDTKCVWLGTTDPFASLSVSLVGGNAKQDFGDATSSNVLNGITYTKRFYTNNFAGTELFKITVTAEDGVTTKDYTLTITSKETADTAFTAYVTLADSGELVTGKDGKPVAQAKITVTDHDADGTITVDDVLYAAHEALYNGGANSGYTSYVHPTYGLSLGKLWGDESYCFGYYVNNASCWSLSDTVMDGDYVTAFIYADKNGYSDAYSFFTNPTAAATAGASVTLTLKSSGYDENWNTVSIPCAGAKIRILGSNNSVLQPQTTDENGCVSLTFTANGSYCVEAYKDDGSIVPAVCKITVTGAAQPTPPAQGDRVYFTLKGDTVHSGRLHVGTSYPTWIGKTAVDYTKGMTVGEVFKAVLDANANCSYNASELAAGYIRSITYSGTTLSEFTNGANSGWMYTVNGEHPLVGLNDCVLSAYDAIVFHYTDDYTQEQGSEQWSGGDSKEKKEETTTASLAPEVTAKNGEATAAVDSKAVSDAIAAAKADGAKEIVIAPVIKGSADKVEVALPTTALESVVADTDAALNVQTDAGAINIPNDTLAEIVKAAGGENISMSVETVATETVADKLPETVSTEGAVAVNFTITSSENTITSFGGKALEVQVPVDTKQYDEGKTYTAFVVSDDDSVEQTTATISDGSANVTMYHFSTVVITKEETSPFTDVKAGAYYYDAVLWAAENGITDGTSKTTFSPNGVTTRAQVVTFLWRAAGCPKAEGKTPFTDVAADTYYSDAVTWAYEQGITGGTSATTFSPNTAVTRAQVVTFLYRYEKPAAGTAVNPFADVQKNAYYYDAVQWAYADGVTDGTDETHFSPNTVCTRGQIVTFLYRDFDSELSESSGVEMRLAEAAAYVLKTTPAPRFGSVGGEWAVLGLARSGSAVPESYYADYYTALEKTVSEAKGVLSTRKYTEYSRVIVALAAIGIDARNVAGYDLTVPLGDYDNTVKQGTSGPVWALIALDSRNYPMPICPDAATSATRQMYIDRLLATQNTDGGWGIGAESASDVDMTAMALQALAKYQEQKAVAAAAERALAFLETAPRVSSESTAQVITALCELGKPVPDELTEELIAYHVSGGGYCHVRGGGVNRMSSEQALYALAAVQRVQTGMPSLYRMER